MASGRITEKQIQAQLDLDEHAAHIAEHYWLGQFWERMVFDSTYSAPEKVIALITPTSLGKELIQQCSEQSGVLTADVTLALYGHFYWHELLIDCQRSDLAGLTELLTDDILTERGRLPYIWGRELNDRLADDPKFSDLDSLPHYVGWELLSGTPTGIFQHGTYVSGPLGIIKSEEHRWLPVLPAVTRFCRRGTKTYREELSFETAAIGVVHAHSWFTHELSRRFGSACEWVSALAWFGSPQRAQQRADYADIVPVIGDCIIGSERTLLLEKLLKSDACTQLRSTLKSNLTTKALASLPPNELSSRLDQYQQFQLLLSLSTDKLIDVCDSLILDRRIDIPASEIRIPHRRGPCKGVCFTSELSSFGIRAAHPAPFAALCSSILRAYEQTNALSELAFRLGCDPSRGVQVSLTEFVRREGPAETVSRLILASHSVACCVCNELGLKLEEVVPRTERTIPRLLWKHGFEIPRHDEILDRLTRRIQQFESMIETIDLRSGESAREKIRAEGVNLFVSVEEFLDRLRPRSTISYRI